MSQIKLLHSGGNGVIIAAPDSNPTQDRTLKLPSDGDGTILTTNSAVGKVLQVIQNVKSDTASWTGTSFSNIAGTDEAGNGSIWEVNITPTKANSKLLVEFSGAIGSNLGVMQAVRLVRNITGASTAYPFLGDASGSSPRVSRHVRDDQTTMKTHVVNQIHFSYLDSPSYTVGNKITYHLEGMGYSSSETVYLNRSGSQQTEATYDGLQASTLTVMEIAA